MWGRRRKSALDIGTGSGCSVCARVAVSLLLVYLTAFGSDNNWWTSVLLGQMGRPVETLRICWRRVHFKYALHCKGVITTPLRHAQTLDPLCGQKRMSSQSVFLNCLSTTQKSSLVVILCPGGLYQMFACTHNHAGVCVQGLLHVGCMSSAVSWHSAAQSHEHCTWRGSVKRA